MGPGEHRPYDHDYWTVPWSTGLFAGDLFEAIPFTDQPTVLVAEDDEDDAAKHFVGPVSYGYGLLITPTCDMADQHAAGGTTHPFRTLVPVLPLALVLEHTHGLAGNAALLRGRDTIYEQLSNVVRSCCTVRRLDLLRAASKFVAGHTGGIARYQPRSRDMPQP